MQRAELQAIALAKLEDAKLLFIHHRHSNAYYLFGYAAEIAIKARIATLFQANTIPDRRLVNDIYNHDLTKLINVAGLSAELREAERNSVLFATHWSTVSNWNESARYEVIDPFSSAAMHAAMVDPDEGIFEWLRTRW